MKLVHTLYIALFLSAAAGTVTAGTISFSGMITEPACTADVDSQHTVVSCIRGNALKQQSYAGFSGSRQAPYNLADITIVSVHQRRDVVLIYK